jgi:DNA-binding Lrp family transcriptional regulator
MAVKTYVLIETQPGKTQKVVEVIRELKGVLSADTVTGPYDAIAILEVETLTEIGSIIMAMTSSISGITRTVTCVAVDVS